MVSVLIYCPVCSRQGNMEVEENIVMKSTRGIAAINVSEYVICDHSFVVYIDKHFMVRDSFTTDFVIELPEIETVQKYDTAKFLESDKIDLYLITINIPALVLIYFLRCGFYKKKLIYVSDLQVIDKYLANFIEYIFKDSGQIDIKIIDQEEYRKNKKYYKDFVVIDNNNIIHNKQNILTQNDLKIEKIIIQKFLAEQDPESSLIIIRNEIYKAFQLSKDIIDFNNNLKKNEEFTSKKIIDHFQETRHFKINKDYLDFLTNIVSNYFGVKLSKSSEASNFLGY